MTDQPRIGIILSTTRPTRFADKPTEWFLDIASKRSDVEFEVVDLRDYPMPFFEEATSPMRAPVSNEAARRWQEKIASLDGFVFVVAEYNHSIPAVLKNALDFTYTEFNRKPATFIGYGAAGATRAVEHLRGMLAELQVADLKFVITIGMIEYLGVAREGKSFNDYPYLADSVTPMIDDLVWWSSALRRARQELQQAA